jgi:sugar/nucleoside kinase (ribokinase family)
MTPVGEIFVIGGSYLDTELLLSASLRREKSTTIAETYDCVGGPGYCYSTRLRELGWSVFLDTVLGSDTVGSRIDRDLAARQVGFLGERRPGSTDTATVITEPGGATFVVSRKELSTQLPTRSLSVGKPTLVASPTQISAVVDGLTDAPPRGRWLYLAPHSAQIAQLEDLDDDAFSRLSSATCAISVNAEDCGRDLLDRFDGQAVIFRTMGSRGGTVRAGGKWEYFRAATGTEAEVTPFPRVNGAGEAFFAAALTALHRRSAPSDAARTGASSAYQYLRRLNERPERTSV